MSKYLHAICYKGQLSFPAKTDNTNRGINDTLYPARTEYNICFIIYL